MESILLTINDDSMLSQIKNACTLLKGVSHVKVVKTATEKKDITRTKGYKEAMADISAGRVYQTTGAEDMFRQILGNV